VLNKVTGMGQSSVKKSTDELFIVFPNPNHGLFSFQLLEEAEEAEEAVTVEVYNAHGQLVKYRNVESCLPYTDYSLNLSEFDTGIYFIKLGTGNRVEIKKILVER